MSAHKMAMRPSPNGTLAAANRKSNHVLNAMNRAGSGFRANGQKRTAVIELKIIASAALTAVRAQPIEFEAAPPTAATVRQEDARGQQQAISEERPASCEPQFLRAERQRVAERPGALRRQGRQSEPGRQTSVEERADKERRGARGQESAG